MPERAAPGYAVSFAVAGGVVLLDQSSKAAAVSSLSTTERVPLIGDVLGLQLAFNPGAILSLGASATWVLTVFGVVAVAVLCVAAARSRPGWQAIGLGAVLGGAIGNVLDRLLSPPGFGRGHVTDFLAYGDWFIGNLADVALAAGAVALVVAGRHRRRLARSSPATGERRS
ncbi:signal peptidase II [Streptomyces sp. AC495_CC817]|uniref:signal peptidase II n=1 Tax=Streptomyces sp. AC495_CC817 TaxID=2823900 RepID=UPI001C264F51|nr:signal peptidase II [Streptomyces sp. AC495_CC817]